MPRHLLLMRLARLLYELYAGVTAVLRKMGGVTDPKEDSSGVWL